VNKKDRIPIKFSKFASYKKKTGLGGFRQALPTMRKNQPRQFQKDAHEACKN
jgi:hypothetical protein